MGTVIEREWLEVLRALVVLGIVVIGFRVMLRILNPAEAAEHLGIIVGAAMVLMAMPRIIARTWATMHLWQQIALVALVVVFLARIRPKRKERLKRRE